MLNADPPPCELAANGACGGSARIRDDRRHAHAAGPSPRNVDAWGLRQGIAHGGHGVEVGGVKARQAAEPALGEDFGDASRAAVKASQVLQVIEGVVHEVVFFGADDVTDRPVQRRGIGFVFQHYAAFKHMTVRENVAFGLKIRKLPAAKVKAKVDDLLDVVGLTGFQSRYPAQLSGGQRQRMALARALAVDPQVLLLDEPFGALDAKVRDELRSWLRRLHDEVHVTTVFVTHDQEEAMEVADRIVVMNQGRIEQEGTPDQVYDELETQEGVDKALAKLEEGKPQ